MAAISTQIMQYGPREIEALLPWYVAGTLNMRDARHVKLAIASDPAIAALAAEMEAERGATAELSRDLGGPSPRVLQRLFAAIDAEPLQPGGSTNGSVSTIGELVIFPSVDSRNNCHRFERSAVSPTPMRAGAVFSSPK